MVPVSFDYYLFFQKNATVNADGIYNMFTGEDDTTEDSSSGLKILHSKVESVKAYMFGSSSTGGEDNKNENESVANDNVGDQTVTDNVSEIFEILDGREKTAETLDEKKSENGVVLEENNVAAEKENVEGLDEKKEENVEVLDEKEEENVEVVDKKKEENVGLMGPSVEYTPQREVIENIVKQVIFIVFCRV